MVFTQSRSLFRYMSYNVNLVIGVARHDIHHSNSKISSCFKQGDIGSARQIFDEMPDKNLVTWNCMISGYVRNGKIYEARKVFDAMPFANIVSWTAMLTGYARCGRPEEARNLFDKIPNKNVVCWNAMISGYLSNGKIDEARELFNVMPLRNTVSWTVIIEGCFRHGLVSEAVKLFNQAPVQSASLYNAMLSGYAELGHLDDSYELFLRMSQKDVASWTTMITCFLRAGKIENARALFEEIPEKDVVVWTVIITGYLHNGNIDEARKLFDEMPKRDIMAWNSMIGGYVQNDSFQEALELFKIMPKRDIVSWNSILQGYVQQDDMITAHIFFEKIPQKDVASWNTLISAYQNEEIFVLYSQMLQGGFRPDQGTFTIVISVCGTLALIGWGRAMHNCVIKYGYENDTMATSSLISMYSKCGFVNSAAAVFVRIKKRDTVAWNAMIVAQAYHGSAVESLKLFSSMIQAGFKPDHVTFVGVLTACAHSGLVNEGWKHFSSMEKYWNLIPKPEHYACIADLLGRSGSLVEAYDFVKQLPVDLPAYTWEALLCSCKVHENFELGELVVQKILGIQSSNVGIYVLISNIYAARGMWEDAANIRALMKHFGAKKEVACSWIELKGRICLFVSNDRSHPRTEDIYKELASLSIITEDIGLMLHF